MTRPPLAAEKPMVLHVKIAVAVGACILPLGTTLAQDQTAAPYAVLESGRSYQTLQQAIDAIGDSRGTIAIAPGIHTDCAVQAGGIVSYLAAEPGTAIFDGSSCPGQHVLALRGRGAEMAGLVFQKIATSAGAAIRLEAGDLTVVESWFRNSAGGIEAGDDPGGRIVIDRTTFSRFGPCEAQACRGHSVSTGANAQLRITRSRFEGGGGAVYVQSGAAQVDIASSSFDVSGASGAGAAIALAAGASGQISNNWFVQNRQEETSPTLVAGTPGDNAPGSSLLVTGNSARLAHKSEQVATLTNSEALAEPESGTRASDAGGS